MKVIVSYLMGGVMTEETHVAERITTSGHQSGHGVDIHLWRDGRIVKDIAYLHAQRLERDHEE